nr:retrotransposon-related protein [Tanacetum cinerariifolium]GFA13110.1 retrotransposon-related protein [Tanacetum cinerariifolium]
MMVANSWKHHCHLCPYTREVLVFSTNIEIQTKHYSLVFRNRKGDQERIKKTMVLVDDKEWFNHYLGQVEESVKNHFRPSKYEDPRGALSKLLQFRTVKDYQQEFKKLMNRVTDIPDSFLISFYIFGLKLHLQREFFVSRPTTLDDAFLLALITEARLDDQVVLLAGTTAKTFGNNDGDESDSLGPVTPTEEDD